MPIILVVDDSKIDRKLIGSTLEKDIDWLVDYAESGKAALDRMRIAAPDVVVTDLLMPEMDGLELVEAVRAEFDHVPVVLVAGEGSEELASRALRSGAASYVPKSHLTEGLVETVEQVLALSGKERHLKRLMRQSTAVRHEFELPNDPAVFPAFIEFVQQTLDEMSFCSAVDRRHVAIALEEALLNAVCHGNLELPSDCLSRVRQELHSSGVSLIVEERSKEAPFCDRKLQAAFKVSGDGAQFVVRDHGRGFDVSSVPAPAAREAVEGAAGRGLVLIQNFMDEVGFNSSGNEIRMVLRRRVTEPAEKEKEKGKDQQQPE